MSDFSTKPNDELISIERQFRSYMTQDDAHFTDAFLVLHLKIQDELEKRGVLAESLAESWADMPMGAAAIKDLKRRMGLIE